MIPEWLDGGGLVLVMLIAISPWAFLIAWSYHEIAPYIEGYPPEQRALATTTRLLIWTVYLLIAAIWVLLLIVAASL